MHEYVDYIFKEVWCKALTSEYGIELFDNNDELKEIIEYLWLQEDIGKPLKSAVFFVTGINAVFNQFKELEVEHIDQLKIWYQSNNDIENCCNNGPDSTPIIYDQLGNEFDIVKNSLESFFKNLYSHNFLKLEILQKHIGKLSDHYTKFVKVNNEDICPFCGLMPLDSEWSESRDAYDHYLPKSKYPFNSINMKNLAPACNTCNTKNKGSDDPINLERQRRKAFYPFSEALSKLVIKIDVEPEDWTKYIPDEISISVGPDHYQEEIKTWLDVYGIEGRYKDYLCRKNFGKAWMSSVTNWTNRGRSIEAFFGELVENSTDNPFSDFNFLKLPFLEVCKRKGLFNF